VTPEDRAAVASLLGRAPRGAYEIVVRGGDGGPVVIRNHPLLDDGTPMPTRYWLIGPGERAAVGRLEAAGGVRAAEAAVDAGELAAAHAAYAAERDAALPPGHSGPRPEGGVGGTRQGVKCLHAHLAWYLAGGEDPVGAWTASQLGTARDSYVVMSRGAVAAVDCGTNSTRLLVAGPDGRTLDRLMTITRLGEGVDETARLAPAAIARTLEVLRQYRAVMDRLSVGRFMATATSAVRDAANAEDFLEPAASVLGHAPLVLPGEREGRLSYSGATAELDPATGPFTVVDVGGGSTELVTTAANGEIEAVSLDVGCVRVTERFLASDPPTQAEMSTARRAIETLLEGASAGPRYGGGRRLVGLAGTVSALAVMSLGLDAYDRAAVHHSVLTLAAVEELIAVMAGVPVEERRRLPGIEKARADVLIGGSLVLAGVMAHVGAAELIVSEADILDGIVAELLLNAGGSVSNLTR
jgi:exopolyphosphatase/guanosine-5'-triphosphate,3'-diphosphate pyrophosphatase